MVGIPKVNRCEHCRRRRVKCDENWPTCSTCRRAKKICSGPPQTAKFVHNGDHGKPTSSFAVATNEIDPSASAGHIKAATLLPLLLPGDFIERETAQEDEEMLIQVRQQKRAGGGTFAKLRRVRPSDLKTPIPSHISRTCVDSVAADVVRCLETTAGTDHDLALSVAWAGLAPPRLYSSPAFCAAIGFYVSTWSKRRRSRQSQGVDGGGALATTAASMILDRKAYGKTLGFLRSALRNPNQAYDTGTLAAIALIHRIEIDFDGRRCFATPSSHAAGLYALTAARGPPRLHDELDVHLCFEIMGRLAMHVIMHEEENFYTHADWTEALREALQMSVVAHSPYRDLYLLGLQIAQWPDLAVESRRFHMNPDLAWGSRVALRAAKLAEELSGFEEKKIRLIWESGLIWTVARPEAPWGEDYHFFDWPTSQIFIIHASLCIVANRVQAAALERVGNEPNPVLEQQVLEWSKRIWKSQAYVERFRVAAATSTASLILSYEGATGDTRDVILSKLRHASSHPDQVHIMTDATLMKACMIATGRLPYPEPYSAITGAPILCHGHGELRRPPQPIPCG